MSQLTKAADSIFNGRLKALSRFSVTGVLNTLIDFCVFTICESLFGIHYTISQVLGYSFGVINSFIFNRKWTFEGKASDKEVHHELIQFVAVNICSLIVTVLCIKFLVNDFSINVYISKVIVTFIAQIINFLLYKLWVFS
ncbi:GtrA family protein [Clostridium sp. WILCCON 0269]|uniref:GtrA family protein n=1 Tax=Candidatus Clostridium eludens TaxID=3381663 RepID=A0ABW8SFZ3_9CLOT